MSEAAVITPDFVEQIASVVVARVGALIAPPAPLRRMLSSAEVMELLGYDDRVSFFAAVRAAKCPMVKINERKIVFDPADVEQWLQKLKTAAPAIRIEIGSPASRRRARRTAQ